MTFLFDKICEVKLFWTPRINSGLLLPESNIWCSFLTTEAHIAIRQYRSQAALDMRNKQHDLFHRYVRVSFASSRTLKIMREEIRKVDWNEKAETDQEQQETA